MNFRAFAILLCCYRLVLSGVNKGYNMKKLLAVGLAFVSIAVIAAPPRPQMPDDVKIYIGHAVGYLQTQNDEGKKVAEAMAGTSDGSVTLTQLQSIISDAKDVTNAGYRGDYRQYSHLVVPKGFEAIDDEIQASAKLRLGAYDDYLKYFNSNNTSYIDSGTKAFKKSELMAQDATKKLTKAMDNYSKPAKKP